MPREIRVLMLEDSEDDCALVVRELESAGYEASYSRMDSAPALREALAQPWDLVLSDYNMPGFTGTAALKMVREREPDLPFIFVSGTIGEGTAVDAMRSGANDYVMKGQLKRLVPAIERELRDADRRRERRRIESELRQSENRFLKVFHTSSIGIAVTSLADGRLLEVNEAFARIVGGTSTLVGRTFDELGLWADALDHAGILQRLRAEGAVRELDLVIRRLNGTPCPVIASFEQIEVTGEACMLTLVHDISDRVRLENELRQSQKMEAVGRLAGGVAHDFNNILTVIMACCSTLDEELGQRHGLQDVVQQVLSAAERAASLTGRLLAFSRRQVVEVRALDLNVVVAGLVPMLRRLIPENIELKTSLTSGLGAIRSDPGQIEQIVLNLVVNARDAMHEGGTLSIETAEVERDSSGEGEPGRAAGTFVRLTVRDTGIGMDEPTLARIFEPFFTTKGVGQGTGLGLSTVYGTVRQHDGFVSVSSEPGRGSTFRIDFPRVDDVVSQPSAPAVAASPAGTETILLVEDEPTVRKLTADMLGRQGYRVIVASDGVMALELVEKHEGRIDLLVTDVVMPRMGGREVAERLKRRHPDVRVLFVSGYTDDMVMREDLVDSGAAFLQKPFTPSVMWKKVRSVLDSASLQP